jgi:hypothetical protein
VSATACDSCQRRWGSPWRAGYHADVCAECEWRAYQQREAARIAALVETAKDVTQPKPV